MITAAAEQLIATVMDTTFTVPKITAAMQSFYAAASRVSFAEANDALSKLAGYISLEDPKGAAVIALVCATMVEKGCQPLAMERPLCERLKPLLEAAVVLADTCRARMPKTEGEDQDPHQEFENIRKQLAPSMPVEAAAWESLHHFWCPAISLFSASAQSRAAARELRASAEKIAGQHEAGHWIQLMLSVLDDDEPILVIEPQTGLGLLARISGVVENFQLNVLLMDGFPKSNFWARRRVSRRVANVARGVGPQQMADIVTGVWNLYTWKAIQPGFKLADPNDYGANAHWIWNEGRPEDIPVFEGRRVVLLGPRSYPRSWRSQRMFDKLPAKLECERRLTKDEITVWLQRMLRASGQNS